MRWLHRVEALTKHSSHLLEHLCFTTAHPLRGTAPPPPRKKARGSRTVILQCRRRRRPKHFFGLRASGGKKPERRETQKKKTKRAGPRHFWKSTLQKKSQGKQNSNIAMPPPPPTEAFFRGRARMGRKTTSQFKNKATKKNDDLKRLPSKAKFLKKFSLRRSTVVFFFWPFFSASSWR